MGTPHLAWPVTLNTNGSFATNEQDSPDELAAAVAVILATPEGSRVEVPSFGSPRSEFGTPDAGAIRAAVLEWEPRVDLDLEVITGLGDIGELTRVMAAVRPHV